MKINNLGYLMKEGVRGIFSHGFMSFAAVFAMVACLLIVGSFSILVYNVNILVDDLNQTNEVLAYIDESLSYAEAQTVETKIRQIDNVYEANLVSREEALEDFIADHENNPAFGGVQAEDLRHRVVVTLEDNALMEQTVAELEAIEGVAKVTASYEMAQGFATIQNVLEIVTLVVAAGLVVVTLLIIYNTVKMAVSDRKDEIAIMKMVGATNGFIRLPFVVEGLLLGLAGAGLAFGGEWLLYEWLVGWVQGMDSLQLFVFVPFQQMLMPMVSLFGCVGVGVGVLGSWISISKFMKV